MAAGALAATPILADGQMVYTNIDPDEHLYNDYYYLLDFNADGFTEVGFIGNHFWTWSSWGSEGHGYSTHQIYLNMVAELAIVFDHIDHLYLGDTVDESLTFADLATTFFYGFLDLDDDFLDIDAGSGWVNNEGYFGVRFLIDTNTHYGWIRLELDQSYPDDMPNLVLREFAYNATPNAPAPIALFAASPATDLFLADIADTGTPADLQLFFRKAENESTVSAYRVALFTGPVTPTSEEMEALAADQFIEILPSGEDVYMHFGTLASDVSGSPINSGTLYKAVVLAIADGVTAFDNEISRPSWPASYTLEVAPMPWGVHLVSDSITNDISGFTGSFILSDTNVSSVRSFITANEVDLETLLALDSNYYMEMMPIAGTNTITFTPDKLVYGAGDPELFETYFLHVVSMPDSITNSIPAMKEITGQFLYAEYATQPTVSIIGYAGNSSDILLEFPHLPNESGLEVYRILVCKAGVEVNSAFVADLNPSLYHSIYPSGLDIYTDLTACDLDTDGDLIVEDQPYVAYVAMRCTCDDYFYSISAPSAEFVLGAPTVGTEDMTVDQLLVVNDHLLLPSGATGNTLRIVNASGQIIFESTVQQGVTAIEMPYLPSGIYIVYMNDQRKMHAKKIMVLSSGGN